MIRALPLLLAGLIVAGCFSAPPMKDPLADVNVPAADSAFKDLAIAVAVSENTRSTFGYALDVEAGNQRWGAPKFASIFPDMKAKMADQVGFFQANFGKVVKVAGPDDIAKAGVDLGVIIDLYPTQIPNMTIQSAKFTTKLILVDGRDGRVLETFSADADGGRRGFRPVYKVMSEVMDASRAKAQAQLLASPLLVERAHAAGKAAPVARRTYHSDVDAPGYSLPEDERKFALVIGIENYGGLPAAEFAERDARAVRRHLVALGYPERQITLLTGDKATRGGIQKYVEEWLPGQVKADSEVVLYFSGHGAPDVDSRQAYLVPWDGDPKYLATTGYPVTRLYKSLAALKARRVLVALDACFSGAGGRSVLAKGLRPLVTKTDEGLSRLGKVVVLAAAGPDEVTGTEDAQGHGLFTYELLKTLDASRGKAAVAALFETVKRRVEDGAHRDGREQTPRLLHDPTSSVADLTF